MNALHLLHRVQAATETDGTAVTWIRLAKHLTRTQARVSLGNFHGEFRAMYAKVVREFIVEGQDQEILYHIRLSPDHELETSSVAKIQIHTAINAVRLDNSKASVYHAYWDMFKLLPNENAPGLTRRLLALLPEKIQDMQTRVLTCADRLEREQHART